MANGNCIFKVIHILCGFCGGLREKSADMFFMCGKQGFTNSQRILRVFLKKNIVEMSIIHILSTFCG